MCAWASPTSQSRAPCMSHPKQSKKGALELCIKYTFFILSLFLIFPFYIAIDNLSLLEHVMFNFGWGIFLKLVDVLLFKETFTESESSLFSNFVPAKKQSPASFFFVSIVSVKKSYERFEKKGTLSRNLVQHSTTFQGGHLAYW